MRIPSERQVRCARWIANALGIEMPRQYSVQAYGGYISTHIQVARESVRKRTVEEWRQTNPVDLDQQVYDDFQELTVWCRRQTSSTDVHNSCV